jgi:hypothetical protein
VLADDPSCANLLPPFLVLRAVPPLAPRALHDLHLAGGHAFTEFRDSGPSSESTDGAATDEAGELDFDAR